MLSCIANASTRHTHAAYARHGTSPPHLLLPVAAASNAAAPALPARCAAALAVDSAACTVVAVSVVPALPLTTFIAVAPANSARCADASHTTPARPCCLLLLLGLLSAPAPALSDPTGTLLFSSCFSPNDFVRHCSATVTMLRDCSQRRRSHALRHLFLLSFPQHPRGCHGFHPAMLGSS